MALKIIDGNATPNSIALFFSDIPNQATVSQVGSYTITLPAAGTRVPVVSDAHYDAIHRATMLTLSTPLQLGDWVLVSFTGGGTTGGGSTGTKANPSIGLQVNGESPSLKKDAGEVTSAVEDAVSYPLLTEQISFPAYTGGGPAGVGYGPGTAPGTSVSAAVSSAVSNVLGWKANATDPKGFIGALSQSFDLAEVEGHVEATWKPRSYAVQTDMSGGISGAQASLYTRAKDALDSAIPLLNGLYPLDPDADPEYVKALREMARSQMTEIVKELGNVGGPSVLRINTYFQILLGQQNIILQQGTDSDAPHPTSVQFDPDQVGGTLGTLRDTYGIYFLQNPFSNSLEDEEDVTNFRIISDYLTSLLQSWISNGRFFLLGLKNQPAFFGTQLVLLSREFSVIGETVNEVRFALDSVFIGPSERQTLLLQFSGRSVPAIFLEDLLREIEGFAAEEGPRLLQDGGRISVANNILPVVKTYREMVRLAHKPDNLKSLPDGYRTIRVQRTLDDLHDQLHELSRLAEAVAQQVPAPIEEPEGFSITSVSPNVVTQQMLSGNRALSVLITGQGFRPGAQSNFGTNTSLTTYVSENLLVANVAGVLAPGTYAVSVTNPDTRKPASLLAGLSVVS